MNNEVNKPITLIVEETKNKIINVINESGLPPFIIDLLFDNISTDIKMIARQQYEKDRLSYINNSKKESDKNEKSIEK